MHDHISARKCMSGVQCIRHAYRKKATNFFSKVKCKEEKVRGNSPLVLVMVAPSPSIGAKRASLTMFFVASISERNISLCFFNSRVMYENVLLCDGKCHFHSKSFVYELFTVLCHSRLYCHSLFR